MDRGISERVGRERGRGVRELGGVRVGNTESKERGW